ncbi:membrane protein [Catellatospora sp. IY07-71]|uniref:EamA family transporter n=1 Tax=Catellatospora sp. IY07-71 TaxID=2728827 RepID=UPI001BB39C96|nr:EamA family transporter [Catellatospora sp. IY07-71]BCJ77092.1 membrane protein [Catellatospora sp. IY07-71]
MTAVDVATSTARRQSTAPAVALILGSMLSVQVGAAASTRLFDDVGPAGTAWLRGCWAALFFIVIARPSLRWLRAQSRRDLAGAVALGAVSAVMSVSFFESIARIPLATAVALEFLGPLSLAVLRRTGRWGLLWPVLALVGVLALTRPWTGGVNVAGVLFALLAGVCWAGYILLTQRVGDSFSGVKGLAIAMPASAVAAAVAGLPQALPGLSWAVLAQSAWLALLLPVLPFALELLALRRLTVAAFGTLMCLEPAFALGVGATLLHQTPHPLQVLGVAFVVIAGIGAQRTGHR